MRAKRSATVKCKCGCGQTNTGRQRKLECTLCGYILYTARGRIAQGMPTCVCGGAIDPPCLQDRCLLPGAAGDAAWAEYAGRAAFSAVQSERGRKGAQIARIGRGVDRALAAREAAAIPF